MIKTGQQVAIVKRDGTIVKSKVQQLQVFDGFGRKNADEAAAGDIVALIGLESVDIGDSICDALNPQPLEPEDVEPPTLTMMFSVNDSPVRRQGRQVRHQPKPPRAADQGAGINVALKVEETEQQGRVQGHRPRPAAPGHPDREHAPRGLRAVASASRT